MNGYMMGPEMVNKIKPKKCMNSMPCLYIILRCTFCTVPSENIFIPIHFCQTDFFKFQNKIPCISMTL